GSLFGGADYVLRCDPIQGAMRYAFTTSLGTSDTAPVGNPQVTIRVPASELGRKQTFEVYATNLSDVNTRTARKTFAAN
ncbi:MAG: hypothetical protein KJ726_10145, partial [Verrucomicrobia bacterium]|nr:hypothetical protein [Verrucomicrobiota bacterium]